MTYRLAVDPKAIAQAAEIHRYYQDIGQALVDRFERELDACYAYIEQNPTGHQARMRDYRHAPYFLASVRRVRAERAGRPVTCELISLAAASLPGPAIR